MICVMVMEVSGDYYCLVLMNPMGPGVMYVMFVAGQFYSLPMGMMMIFLEMLLTFYMMIGTLHEHLCGIVLHQFCF